MNNIYDNLDYINIVDDILKNEDFLKLKNCRHHGLNRYDHSLRVSYYSYLVAKALKLDYVKTARAGLLHDFFTNEDLTSKMEQRFSAFCHPYKSLANAQKRFYLSEMESDIIISHMFPMLPHKVPKYIESWLVSGVDKLVATYEFYYAYGRTYAYRLSNLYFLALLLR